MQLKKLAVISFTFLTTFVVVAVFIAAYYFDSHILEGIEARTYDLRYRLVRGPLPPNPEIAIIAIDDKSVGELGRYPWDRSAYAPLIDRITEAGAKALLMDAFFPEPTSPKEDQAFADAMKRSGKVVLATAFNLGEDDETVSQTISIPLLTDAAAGTAHINFLPDADGVNRWTKLIVEHEGGSYPSLGLMGAMIALGSKDMEVGDYYVQTGDRTIYTDYDHKMLINYTGPPGTFETFSFVDVAKGRIPDEKLRGRIFYMGATSLGIYDMRVSPFFNDTPGVEINATVADSIISGRTMERGGIEAIIDMASMALLGLLVYIVAIRVKPAVALPVTVMLAMGWLAFAYYMFLHGMWICVVYQTGVVIVTYSLTWYSRYLLLDRKSREIKTMFSSYVSPKIVDQIVKDPTQARIGGDTKDVTVLFSDIKGYTSFSENRTPHEVVATLNEYLGEMSRVIMDSDGTLDKFIGDGIMAYWGAPLKQDEHYLMALDCAMRMFEEMGHLQEDWKRRGMEPLGIRIGINSGPVVAGNIGVKGKKMEYTVIGDTVNLASRLEAAGKYYGVSTLVGERTVELGSCSYVFRELDSMRVVGKKMPVTIYDIIGHIDNVTDEDRKYIEDFRHALSVYRSKQFIEARALFGELAARRPGDRPATLYINRCADFLENPPPEDWDGVYNRKDK